MGCETKDNISPNRSKRQRRAILFELKTNSQCGHIVRTGASEIIILGSVEQRSVCMSHVMRVSWNYENVASMGYHKRKAKRWARLFQRREEKKTLRIVLLEWIGTESPDLEKIRFNATIIKVLILAKCIWIWELWFILCYLETLSHENKMRLQTWLTWFGKISLAC